VAVSSWIARTAKSVLPHGVVMATIRTLKRRRLKAFNPAVWSTNQIPYSYDAAINFLSARGVPRNSAIGGSIPDTSLDFCSEVLDRLLPKGTPLMGLHVGNFVGISLCYFTNYVRNKNDKSVIMSIDPNLTCMGIHDPQGHVISLLNYFGLQRNALIFVGYSTKKSISNDGSTFIDEKGLEYDPFSSYQNEQSCEHVLENLCVLSESRFDFAIMDGNHERSYLQGETLIVKRLLKPGGILILDDVSDVWTEIKAEFDELRAKDWSAVAANGRVGVLQRAS